MAIFSSIVFELDTKDKTIYIKINCIYILLDIADNTPINKSIII